MCVNPLKQCKVQYDERNKRVELVHPILGTLMVIDVKNSAIDRAIQGWSQMEADAMLIMGYSVEHWDAERAK
jgi:hypothetical protein